MKSLLLLCFVVVFQFGYSQNKKIDINNIFITNKLTGRSVKLGASANTLKTFGEPISADTNYVDKVNLREVLDESRYIKYIFEDIIFYTNIQNKITEFETESPNIEITRNGMFSISPSNSMDEIARLFPEILSTSRIIYKGPHNEKKYIGAWIPLSYKPTGQDELIEIDKKIGLLFNPSSKILEKIYIWTRP